MSVSRSTLLEKCFKSKHAVVICVRGGLKSTTDHIKNRLHADNLQKLNESCLGLLFEISQQKFEVMVGFLAMMHVVDGPRGSLRFQFGNEAAQLVPQEYFLLTGLKFGSPVELPSSSELHRIAFAGRTDITVGSIQHAFNCACDVDEGRGDLALQLALVWLVYDVLFAHGCGHTKKNTLDLKYLHAADDIEFFNNYHWGLESYNFLIEHFYKAYDRLVGKVAPSKDCGDIQVDLHGFPHVVTYFVHETIICVDRYCTDLDVHPDSIFSRMLRRFPKSRLFYKELKVLFMNLPEEVPVYVSFMFPEFAIL